MRASLACRFTRPTCSGNGWRGTVAQSETQRFTIEEIEQFCEKRKIILVDVESYGGDPPIIFSRRKVAWGYVKRHIHLK